MSDSGPSTSFFKTFGFKVGVGVVAAGLAAFALGAGYLSFKEEERELKLRGIQELKEITSMTGTQKEKPKSNQEKFKEMWVALAPVIQQTVEEGAVVGADALLIINALVRVACADHCSKIVETIRAQRRKDLNNSNFYSYARTPLIEALLVGKEADSCLFQILERLGLPQPHYQQSLNIWGQSDPLIGQVRQTTIAELCRIEIDEEKEREMDNVTFEAYLEMRKYSFEKYKKFEEEFEGNLLDLVFGEGQIKEDPVSNDRAALQGELTRDMLKKIATSVINCVSDDLTYSEYGFEKEELRMIGNKQRENSQTWDQDPRIQEIVLLYRLQIQEDKLTYSELE